MSTGDVSATAFSSNDRDVMERDISASPDVVVSREDLNDFFDLPHCAEFVQDGNYSKVAHVLYVIYMSNKSMQERPMGNIFCIALNYFPFYFFWYLMLGNFFPFL